MNEAIRALQSAVSGVFRIGGEIWTWVIAQVGRLAQVNWLALPLWKQIAVILVAAGAGYCFYQVYKPIWNSFKQLLGAFGSFVSTLITTLPRSSRPKGKESHTLLPIDPNCLAKCNARLHCSGLSACMSAY